MSRSARSVSPTFVSCLYDLERFEGSRRLRSVADLLRFGEPLLAAPVPLVVFADPEVGPTIVSARSRFGNGHLTRVVPVPLEAAPQAHRMDETAALLRAGRRSPTIANLVKDTAAFAALCWSKPGWLAQVAADDPFDGDRVAWIDFGIAHVAEVPEGERLRGIASAGGDAVRCAVMKVPGAEDVADRERYYRSWPVPAVVGGFLTAGRSTALELVGRFDAELTRCLGTGWPALEETVLGAVLADHRELFDPVDGDHSSIFTALAERAFAEEGGRARKAVAGLAGLPSARRAEGARRLLGSDWLPADVEMAARGMECEQLPQLSELGARVGSLLLPAEPAWRSTNPTIASDGEGFRAVVRQVNYRLLADGSYDISSHDGVVRTRNVLVGLTPSLEVAWSIEIDDTDAHVRAGHGRAHGLEDLRLVSWSGAWRALCVVAESRPDGGPRVALVTLDDEARVVSSVLLQGPDPERVEKNWVPLVGDDPQAPLRALYGHRPAVVVELDASTGVSRTSRRHVAPLVARHLRGGSQLVRVGDEWLGVAHETLVAGSGPRWYQHRVVRFDDDFDLRGVSRPFTFAGARVEFCCGLAVRDDRAVLTFGVGDGAAGIAEIPLDALRGLATPLRASLPSHDGGERGRGAARAVDTSGLRRPRSTTAPAPGSRGRSRGVDRTARPLRASIGERNADRSDRPHGSDGSNRSDRSDGRHGSDGSHGSDRSDGSARSLTRSGTAGRLPLCLAMIVRDEAAVIERCIASVRGIVDRWVICDTGSRDATSEVITRVLAGVPGRLLHRPWVDFGTNRNELLAAVEAELDEEHLVLLLDADMTLDAEPGVLDSLPGDADAFHLPVIGEPTYWMPYLVRSGRSWRYVGATHEYLGCAEPVTFARVPGLRLRHWADGGTRHEKLERDLALLRRADAEHPDDQRTTFYLAQTLRDAGHRTEAVRSYLRRADLGGWDEEVFCSLLEAGRLLADQDWDAAVPVLLRAHDARPHRAEALYELAAGYRRRGMHHVMLRFTEPGVGLVVPDDLLFVDRWIYDWGLRFEHSIALWWAGRIEESVAGTEALLAEGRIDADHREAAEANLLLARAME